MLIEALVAFVIVLSVSLAFYATACLRRPSLSPEDPRRSTYSCGENVRYNRFKISVTFSQYLVYFVILDSAALLIALSALASDALNPLAAIIYLLTVFAAVALLRRGE
jgi:NADH:ubiquinone oxidoreductase subunit 3 (subunit A)